MTGTGVIEGPLASSFTYAVVLVVVAIASAVKGALGFGFPLLVVPITANLIGTRTAVVLMAVPTLFASVVVLARGGGRLADAPRFVGFYATLIIGTTIGAHLFQRLDPRVLNLTVGGTALLFAALASLGRIPVPSLRTQRYAGPVVGFFAGLMGGTTAIFTPVVTSYFLSLQLEKRMFVFWVTTAFLIGGTTQVLTFAQLGLYAWPQVGYALAACLPVLPGAWLGFWIQDRLPALRSDVRCFS